MSRDPGKDKIPNRSTCELRSNRRGAVHNWKLVLTVGNINIFSCQDCPAIRRRKIK